MKNISIPLLYLFLILLLVRECTSSIREHKLSELQAKLRRKLSSPPTFTTPSTSSTSSLGPKKNGRVFYPIGYGADPSGVNESSDAILLALKDAIKLAQNGLQLLDGINDLGGVVIDLQGGNYKISKSIRFPEGAGNIVVQSGSFRASETFPGDRHLVELYSLSSPKNSNAQASLKFYYEDITFRDILFDSTFRGGGIFIIDSARIRINNCFFLHFSTEGILVQNGHETYVSNSFLGQHSTVGGDKGEKDFSGTAIDLSSNDNAVTDVVIFSAATGVILRGKANIVTGVHCYNKATAFGGVGILVKAAQSRISNCYLDFNAIVIEDPNQVHVTNGFFLGDGNIVLKSINGHISGLNIVDNMFSGEGDPKNMKPIIEINGKFNDIHQVVIMRNNVNGMRLKSTVGKLSVGGNGTKWVVDFSPVLVFPNRINHVQYSFYNRGGARRFVAHAATNVSNNKVVVESDKAVNAVVSMVVDQYNMVGEGDL